MDARHFCCGKPAGEFFGKNNFRLPGIYPGRLVDEYNLHIEKEGQTVRKPGEAWHEILVGTSARAKENEE